MALISTSTTISVNGGPELPGNIEEHTSFYEAAAPDRSWEFTDDAGHWHAFSDDGDLPTLTKRLVHVDCDGVHTGPLADPDEPCEGYDVTEWHCRICDAVAEPKWVTGSKPGLRDWRGEVHRVLPVGTKVTVRATTDAGVAFGVACVVGLDVTAAVDGAPEAVSRLVGDGALGRRAFAKAEVRDRALARELRIAGYRPGTAEWDGALAAARVASRSDAPQP